MVKITNKLGDIKTGKQGEAVYQGKYGEHIRRQAAPKRAMASEAQVAHRQLYRNALAWRKQLSLPNRRYLDGYCMANGVVDSYHIPLPWSRFALKLYLQKVKFVVITKATFEETQETGKQEYYDNEPLFNSSSSIYGASWKAQTFTPQVDFELIKAELYLYRVTNPGWCYLDLYATDENGLPTGSSLSTTKIYYTDIPETYSWVEWLLTHPKLDTGVKYAIVAHVDSTTSSKQLVWAHRTPDADYPRGDYCWTNDSGSTWYKVEGRDSGFRIYGTAKETIKETGLLHVRHPALLTVVHKRGEQTINGYDTLSSLDDEQLTGQVGLDVEVGDTIKATTLPGIDYPYEVH